MIKTDALIIGAGPTGLFTAHQLKLIGVDCEVVDNLDNDSSVLLRRLYDSLYETLVSSSIPAAVLIIEKYQYQIAFVADQEINLLAALTEIMVECEFK